MIRIRVSDWHEERVEIEPADNLDVLAWIPAQGKALIWRARDEEAYGGRAKAGPEKPEFHLLDPATGEVTKVTGDFRPYQARTVSKLQPTGRVDEVWVAIPSAYGQPPETAIGRYDTRTFTFTEQLKVPGVRFASSDLWVEEPMRRLTFTVNGDILRLILPD